MTSNVFEFLWSFPEDGYQWRQEKVLPSDGQDEDPRPQWVLTDGLALGASYMKCRYPPLRMYSSLFRTFAQTPPTREGILDFANRYGLLGIAVPLEITAPHNPNQLLGVWGETFKSWVKEIDSLRRALEIWDFARSNDIAALGRFLRWRRAGEREYWAYDSHPDLPSVQEDWRKAIPPGGRHTKMVEPVLDLIRPDDITTAALFLIQGWINDHLKDQVAPRMIYDLDLGRQVLRFVPHSLLGAMWLQLAQAIDARKEYRACKECGKWFEVSLEDDGRTKRRLFCSEPCKSREYRQRRDRARQLASQGMPAKEIAEELSTSLPTVKKWMRAQR